MAGCGQGNDPPPDATERIHLRRQALDWLGEELAALERIAASGPPDRRPASRIRLTDHLSHWKRDPDLAGVREPDALETFDQAERDDWRAFWAEVDAVIGRSN